MINEIKKKVIKYIGFYSLLVLLCFLRALATYVFIVPNGFAPGGVSGIASILYNAVLPYNAAVANTWLNPAVTIFVLNAPLLVLSFKKIGKSFSINTTICVALYAAIMAIFSIVDFPQFKASGYESSVMILAALGGGVLSGVTLGVMLLVNTSAGGTDIIGKAVYLHNPVINVQWIIFIADAVVVLLSGILGFISASAGDDATQILIKVMTPIFYSFIAMYAASAVAEVIDHGVESSVVFNIISDKAEEISAAIVLNLKRGATIVKGEGTYTHSERKIVICVVRKKQLISVKRLILKIDPQAFLFITNAREVNGQGFKSISG